MTVDRTGTGAMLLAALGAVRDALGAVAFARIRGGLEWYQLDRHFGLGLTFAFRQARGFEKTTGSDSPLAGDVGLALRYAF